MIKADLHIHSEHSGYPNDWFLQRIGARECYNSIDYIYKAAKEQGMDFVTITDQDNIDGALELKKKYPEDTFISCELTSSFPEDGCKVHVLVYNIDEQQFEHMRKIQNDVYVLREYMKNNNIVYSVAHPVFPVSSLLSVPHMEKLILLFDVFEGITGTGTKKSNEILMQSLEALTPRKIAELREKHNIEPISADSWNKVFTGGSNDHSGLHIGRTYTIVHAHDDTIEGFLEQIMKKRSIPEGSHMNYRHMAMSIYKIAYEYSKTKSNFLSKTIMKTVNRILFENKSTPIFDRIAIEAMKFSNLPEKKELAMSISTILDEYEDLRDIELLDKIDWIYKKISDILDVVVGSAVRQFSKQASKGNVVSIINTVSGVLPAFLVTVPFFSTIKVLNDGRKILADMKNKFHSPTAPGRKKYLWMTDTIADMNGISETLRKMANICKTNAIDEVRFASCLLPEEDEVELPDNVIKLKLMASYPTKMYKTYTTRIPSILDSLKKINDFDPDEIIISTPGPVGLLGLLAAKVLQLPCSGVFHTDYAIYTREVVGDDSLRSFVNDYIKLFYSQFDTILVPTQKYIDILAERGFQEGKMVLFPRGIDGKAFYHDTTRKKDVKKSYGIRDGYDLVYAGRVSKEKNINFLFDIYEKLAADHEDINLIICGDGQDTEEAKTRMDPYPGVYFLGRISRSELIDVYNASDLFVFPSITDTFGMVILEAFATGLPCIVTDMGGPQELVESLDGGSVLAHRNATLWVNEILKYKTRRADPGTDLAAKRRELRDKTLAAYSWKSVLESLFR